MNDRVIINKFNSTATLRSYRQTAAEKRGIHRRTAGANIIYTNRLSTPAQSCTDLFYTIDHDVVIIYGCRNDRNLRRGKGDFDQRECPMEHIPGIRQKPYRGGLLGCIIPSLKEALACFRPKFEMELQKC